MYISFKVQNNLKFGFLIVAAVLLTSTVYGQREIDKKTGWSIKERLYYGGGFDLGGGSNYFHIGLNPTVGYMINPKLSAGIGVFWRHLSYTNVDQAINQYGVNIFARYNFHKNLFAYGEYGFLNTPTTLSDQNNRTTIFRLPLGIGFSQPIGERGAFNIIALYDVIYNQARSGNVYASPWGFRVYFIY